MGALGEPPGAAVRGLQSRSTVTRTAVFVLALLATLTIVATSFAEVVQQGTLRVSIAAQIKPYRLPRSDPAPIRVLLAGHVFTSTGQTPPQLRRMTVLINRHGEIQPRSVPTCRLDQIHPATTAQALQRCGSALVGSGHFWASVVLPEQGVYHTTGRLLAFNGVANGKAALLAQIYTTQPFPSSFVVPFYIHQIGTGSCSGGRRQTELGKDTGSDGRGANIAVRDPTRATEDTAQRCVGRSPYGTELSGALPEALGSWGFVDRIKMTLGREVQVEGRTQSYLDASCPAPKGTRGTGFTLALANFYFAGGETLSATVPKSCGVTKE